MANLKIAKGNVSHPIAEKSLDRNRLILAPHTSDLKTPSRATKHPRHVEQTYPGTGVSLEGKRLACLEAQSLHSPGESI